MGTQINNFEVTNYTTTKLKIKATTAKVPEIMNDVSTISNQLTTITEELKKLVEEDIQSSDFVSETNNIITVSNNINAALATTMKSLINDAYERILKVSDESKAFQNDLSEASNVVKKSLDELDGIGNKKTSRLSTSGGKSEQSNTNTPVNDGVVINGSTSADPTVIDTVSSTPSTAEPTSNWSGPVLSKKMGVNQGPNGKETYYNLDMSRVVENMHDQGYEGNYWVRDDGVKMFGDYVIVAANLDVHPRGSIIESSLGPAIVCDTGGFAADNPNQIDIATSW